MSAEHAAQPGDNTWCTICDPGLITTRVEPVFGQGFTVDGDYEPSRRERLFGRRRTA